MQIYKQRYDSIFQDYAECVICIKTCIFEVLILNFFRSYTSIIVALVEEKKRSFFTIGAAFLQ
mgnify:CR=1